MTFDATLNPVVYEGGIPIFIDTERDSWNIDELLENKEENSILWVGRIIDWKRPEYAILLANYLKNNGVRHKLRIIGTGENESSIKKMIETFNLSDYVEILGAMSPEDVRSYMEKSEIFIFTSNRSEGWGAVLNEAMNSGCAVVASHAIGSAPFLIEDSENGFIFDSENVEDFYKKVFTLLNNRYLIKKFGRNAYKTIYEEWNPRNAAEQLVNLIQGFLSNSLQNKIGRKVCCYAEKLDDNWYTRRRE